MQSRDQKSTIIMSTRTNQGTDLFYQTPTDYSEEEIQRSLEFVKKLQQAYDERLFHQFVGAMESYLSGSVTYIDLKHRLFHILRNHKGLLEEFRQLLSDFASPVRNHAKKEKNQTAKSDVDRTVGFLNKVEALGESVYKAFVGALGFPGDIETLIEQLDEILRDHESLKEEFETFLIDSRLLKRKRDLDTVVTRPVTEDSEECMNVTPSYRIRPEAEQGSSSRRVYNGKYYSVGSYDPEDVEFGDGDEKDKKNKGE